VLEEHTETGMQPRKKIDRTVNERQRKYRARKKDEHESLHNAFLQLGRENSHLRRQLERLNKKSNPEIAERVHVDR
jgi:hypothetical protein